MHRRTMNTTTFGRTLGCVALVAACQSDPAGNDAGFGSDGEGETQASEESGESGESGGSDGETTSGDTSDTDTGSSTGTGGAKLDVAPPDGEDDGCEKIDFLFVIDSSVSMFDNQQNLLQSFPGFMDSVEDAVGVGGDYHILVADTDEEGRCNKWVCNNPGEDPFDCPCFGPESGDPCEVKLEECDTTLGAGVVHPIGENASNVVCDVAGGNRYIVPDDPDLLGTFTCLASVGEAGNGTERPMDAMVAALSPELNEPGGCNEGFLREDAILVITFISDDPNYEDAGTPEDWYQAVVDAKGGDDQSMVVLGLVPEYPACAADSGACGFMGGSAPKKSAGAHWRDFVGLFGDRGMWAQVCEPDYSPFFQEAVDLVKTTCDEFEPPG